MATLDREVETPRRKLTGIDFEKLVIYSMDRAKAEGRCDAGKYGVQASFQNGQWQPIGSLPDFEGAIPGGRQFVFDAKVCSSSSLDLHSSKVTARQLSHMLKRSQMGVPCFLLVHFSERVLKTRTDPAWTCALPVHPEQPLWSRWLDGGQKGINRKEAELYGCRVRWVIGAGCHKSCPDVLQAVYAVAEKIDPDRPEEPEAESGKGGGWMDEITRPRAAV